MRFLGARAREGILAALYLTMINMERLVEALKFIAGLLGLFGALYMTAGFTLLITWSKEAAELAGAAAYGGCLALYVVFKIAQYVVETRRAKRLERLLFGRA